MVFLLAAMVGASAAALVGALLVLLIRRPAPAEIAPATTEPADLLLVDGKVASATPQARRLFDCGPHESLGWAEIRAVLEPVFGRLPAAPPDVPLALHARDATATRLELLPEKTGLRLRVISSAPGAADWLRRQADRHELARLRRVLERAPMPIWQTDAAQRIVWSNAGFADLCDRAGRPDAESTPFDTTTFGQKDGQLTRASIEDTETGRAWFEVQSVRQNDGWLHYAQSIDAVISAEIARDDCA